MYLKHASTLAVVRPSAPSRHPQRNGSSRFRTHINNERSRYDRAGGSIVGANYHARRITANVRDDVSYERFTQEPRAVVPAHETDEDDEVADAIVLRSRPSA